MNKKSQYPDPLEVIGRAKGYSRNELIMNLPRHLKFTPNLIQEVEKLPEVFLRNSGSPMAKKFIRMMREISLETYRAMQFTRTEINDRGILYGVVSLKHRVMDRVLSYFHKRWSQCVICLYNEHNGITGIIDEQGIMRELNLPLKEIVEKIRENRPIIPYFEDIQFSGDQIFETLYKSQNIIERENPRFFKKMIPNYCYELPGMRKGAEKRYIPRNKKLDEFF